LRRSQAEAELDPTGFLLEQEPDVWTHVRIPLEAEENEIWTFPISGRIVERKAGEILMPTRFPPATVEQLRSRRLVFAGQYQQRPAPVEGNLIKRSEVRYYGGIDPRTGQPDEKFPQLSTEKFFLSIVPSRIWLPQTTWRLAS
jgi:hypothetical protein